MPEPWDIPLQAGQNIPQFGMNNPGVQNALITQMKLQQARQVEEQQNALKQLYANPSNYDPKTLAPTPEAMGQLARTAPAMALDLQHNIVTQQQRELLTQNAQLKAAGELQGQLQDFRARMDSFYNDQLKKGIDPKQAIANTQEFYSEQLKDLLPNIPVSLRGNVNPTFDPVRNRAMMQTAKTVEQQQRDRQEAVPDTDYGRTPPVRYLRHKDGSITAIDGVTPYKPTGVAAPAKAETELFAGVTADGKTVTVQRGATGGWEDTSGKPVEIKTILNKIGTQPQMPGMLEPTATGADVHGEEYLKSLPSNAQAQVKALAEGRQQFPSGFALRSPYWQQMLQAVAQYDPSFDAVNYNARASTRRDFTSGPAARNVTSVDTAIGHMGTLLKAADNLENSNWRAYNTIRNFVRSETGNPKVVEFNTARQAVADEMERAFRGTGGNVTGIKEWEKTLDAANSPEQLHGAIRQGVDLLSSRIDALNQQYQRGMGTTSSVFDLLTPKAKQTLRALPGGKEITPEETQSRGEGGAVSPEQKGEEKPAAAGGAQQPAPMAKKPEGVAEPKSEEEYNALPSGTPYWFKGRVMRKP